ncbi:Holliday junction branch migration complex subunit RuvA-like [Ylistrum balloti]|uniref:Holliday junction branch migration complex subunit RuvA-like n=1 Tax=Ylistrum balloti TaxID=509963 RepID=UPI002905A5FB|nr:Holliday junction branch migration complex subunit RuvA-like [Ylistrum balloti]
MFDYLFGKITFKEESVITIDNQGVGYLVYVPLIFAQELAVEEDKKVYIHQVVGEKENTLYGFRSRLMRSLFQSLIGVSGVGPKMAIKVLDDFSPEQLLDIFANKRIEQLKNVKGLGSKTREKIFIDLNKKAKEMIVLFKVEKNVSIPNSSLEQEVKASLIQLGYKESELKDVVPSIIQDLSSEGLPTIERVIKDTLEKLSKLK